MYVWVCDKKLYSKNLVFVRLGVLNISRQVAPHRLTHCGDDATVIYRRRPYHPLRKARLALSQRDEVALATPLEGGSGKGLPGEDCSPDGRALVITPADVVLWYICRV